MKTPEEIKKGLKLCSHEGHGEEIICQHCPYDNNSSPVLICTSRLSVDALAYIQQLESCLAQAYRERDAALHDLKNSVDACMVCKWLGEECRSRNELNRCALHCRGRVSRPA